MIKQSTKGFIFVLIAFFLFLQITSASIGVKPASYEVDFQPNLKQSYAFNFFQDSNTELEVYADGDMAQYVKLSTNKLIGGGDVNVTVNFPTNVDVPGVHRIYIGARQVIENKGGFNLVGNIQGVIKVEVPYPGQYLEIALESTNANAGQDINLKLKINNLGNEIVSAKSRIEVYEKDGKTLKHTIPFDSEIIEPTKNAELSYVLDTSSYNPGDYKVVAFVEYGDDKTARKEAVFRLGEMRIEVINYTSSFKKDTINRMEISVESFWNDPIENLYATVEIPENGEYFQTPSITIKGFEKSMLTGFFDSDEIKDEPFSAKITLHYSNKTNEKVVNNLVFKSDSNNYVIYIVIATVVITILLLVIIYLLRRNNVHRKK